MRGASIVRPLVVLSAAAFASVATMRVADPLIPQVAGELDVSFGDASVITTAFAISYGFCQLVWGALGDRFGKYRLVALMTLLSAATVALAGLADSLAALGAARLLSGATAAAIIPLAFAFIGDHVPYEQRQTVLGRFLTGTILGIIAGQAAGGVLGDLVGWRGVFFLLGGVFLLVGLLLAVELRSGRVPPPLLTDAIGPAAVIEAYLLLLRRPWARVVLVTVAVEGFLFYGAFTFVGAYLHDRFDLGYAVVGLLLGCMGLGGLTYVLTVRRLLRALGERGLALLGGLITTFAFFVVALGGLMAMAPAIVLLGLGIHMLHNTLQTHATQMAPGARGLAVATFANVLFMGQAAGVWLCGLLIDGIGFAPVFIVLGTALAVLGGVFAQMLAAAPPHGLRSKEARMIPSYSDHAANERTFLAWIRTGLTIMALGFVIERLDLFLASLGPDAPDSALPMMRAPEIHVLSVGLVTLAIILIAGAGYRFVDINRAIDAQDMRPFRGTLMPLGMALVLFAVGVLLLLYLLHLI